MEISVRLTYAPILTPTPPATAEAGAWVEFQGLVRGLEQGVEIEALEYEALASMAVAECRRQLLALEQHYPCLGVQVIHRLGRVPVGESAIYIGVAARHRQEAFGMLAAFMDALKTHVPIWKRTPVTMAAGVGAADA